MTATSPSGPRPRIAATEAYRRPIPGSQVLKLDANEGAKPPPELLHSLLDRGTDLLRRYPDVSALETSIASRLAVPPARVYVTAGADDAIERCCRAYLDPKDEILMTEPSFYLFGRCAKLAGSTVRRVPWMDGPFPRQPFLRQVTDRTAVIALVSPNNPTGATITLADVSAVASAAPHALVVLDHAYVEYADEDLTLAVQGIPNVVVLRTLSKAWGLAGCRVGYAVGHPDLIGPLRAAGQPYSVAAPSAALALVHLQEGRRAVDEHISQVKRERERLSQLLGQLALHPLPSQANFVTVDCGNRARFIHRALETLGVAVRDYLDQPALESFLRITMPGDDADFETLARALRICTDPDGLVLDVDALGRDASGSDLERLGQGRPVFGVTTSPRTTDLDGLSTIAAIDPGSLGDAIAGFHLTRPWFISCDATLLRIAGTAGALPITIDHHPAAEAAVVAPSLDAVKEFLR